jgi:hypothetical protein
VRLLQTNNYFLVENKNNKKNVRYTLEKIQKKISYKLLIFNTIILKFYFEIIKTDKF